MSKSKSFRHFSVRAYFENNAAVDDFIRQFGNGIRNYAYILHDLDVYHDNTEDHIEGEIKKAHYHIIINTREKLQENTFIKMCQSFSPENKFNKYSVQHTRDIVSAFNYLTHNTLEAQQDGKYIYPEENIKSNNKDYFVSTEAEKICKDENTDGFLDFYLQVIEAGYCSKELFDDFCRTYGRDFIINSARIIKTIEMRLGHPMFENNEERLGAENMR